MPKSKQRRHGNQQQPAAIVTAHTVSSNWRALVKASNATVENDHAKTKSVLDKVLNKVENSSKLEKASRDWIFEDDEVAAAPKPKKSKIVEKKDMATVAVEAKGTSDANVRNKAAQATKKKVVAIDCEFVGAGPYGMTNVLARCSLVDFDGNVLLDTFVKPKLEITDYRTHVSGVRKTDFKAGLCLISPKPLIRKAITFEEAQKKVSTLLESSILVGHSVHHDLKALMLSHPRKLIRDTSKYAEFRKHGQGRTPSLKTLAMKLLHREIQEGEHSSVVDAQTTMDLYKHSAKAWEAALRKQRFGGKKK